MSRTLTYTVPPAWDGRTVKDFARQHLGLSSRAFVKQKYLPGGLMKNGQPCRSVDLLRAGDRLCLTLPEEAETYQAVEGPLSILYEDQDYLAVDKPPAKTTIFIWKTPIPSMTCGHTDSILSYYSLL